MSNKLLSLKTHNAHENPISAITIRKTTKCFCVALFMIVRFEYIPHCRQKFSSVRIRHNTVKTSSSAVLDK